MRRNMKLRHLYLFTFLIFGPSLSAQAFTPLEDIPAVFCKGYRADDTNKTRPYVLRPSWAEQDYKAANKQGYNQGLLLAEIDPAKPGQEFNPPSKFASQINNLVFVGSLYGNSEGEILLGRFAPRNLDTMHTNEAAIELRIPRSSAREVASTLTLTTRLQADRTLGNYQTIRFEMLCSR